MKKLIVLLFLAFFLFGFKNSSDAFENSNLPKNCKDYMSYCLKQKPCNYCTDIAESYYLHCWLTCKGKEFSVNFCKKECSCDLSLRWKFLSMQDLGVYFYDLEGITWSSERVAKVWWKEIFTEKGKEERVRKFGEKYKKIDYVLFLSEINCATREIRVLKTSVYSSDGTPITSETSEFYSPFIRWELIISMSPGKALFSEVCSKKDK
jgi:hypothetical protein